MSFFACKTIVEREQCTICLDNLKFSYSRPDKCRHKFHTKCLRKWTGKSATCPCCRGDFVAIYQFKNTKIPKFIEAWSEKKGFKNRKDLLNWNPLKSPSKRFKTKKENCVVCLSEETFGTIGCAFCANSFHINCLPYADKQSSKIVCCPTCMSLNDQNASWKDGSKENRGNYMLNRKPSQSSISDLDEYEEEPPVSPSDDFGNLNDRLEMRQLVVDGINGVAVEEVRRVYNRLNGVEEIEIENHGHRAVITYKEEAFLDDIMLLRPHVVSGRELMSRRRPAADKPRTTIISLRVVDGTPLDTNTLFYYFHKYGLVKKVVTSKDTYFVHFDDYDSVDLCAPEDSFKAIHQCLYNLCRSRDHVTTRVSSRVLPQLTISDRELSTEQEEDDEIQIIEPPKKVMKFDSFIRPYDSRTRLVV